MFNEILTLGNRLEQEGNLPAPGYYYYSDNEPIKWVIHFNPQTPEKSEIRETPIDKLPRPFSGRTGNVQAYPLADEAAYVLGIDRGKGKGKKINEKHKAFLAMLSDLTEALKLNHQLLSNSIDDVKKFIISGQLKNSDKWQKIESKDWVSIQIEGPETDGSQLFENPAIRGYWIEMLSELCKPEEKGGKKKRNISGYCGLSGNKDVLVGRIPLKVKINNPSPFHSINADAFVSGMEGVGVYKQSHLGQSIIAGDLIARTLNYLGREPLHNKTIARAFKKGKLVSDSHENLLAFYWIDAPEEEPKAISVDVTQLLKNVPLILGKDTLKDPAPDLTQLEALLNSAWSGQSHGLSLNDRAFCFLMLSPNKGRISVREWFKVGLERMRGNLKDYLDSQRIEDPDGKNPRCFSINDLLRALDESNISQPLYKSKELANPNITRALLRCAYLGNAPPAGLLERAVICFRHPKVLKRYEDKQDRERFAELQQQLASVMKMMLTHPKLEVDMSNDANLSTLDAKSPAFLSGSLLAVLEAAQLVSMNWKINTTLVDQFYSTASSAPFSVMGMLVSRITSQHMPKLRKNMPRKYETLETLLEELHSALDGKGGFPRTLSMKQQAEFSLGFYTQRFHVAEILKK